MSGDGEREVFRAGVGLVVLDADDAVLVLERDDVAGAWQLPQGGLHAGEEPEEAAWRELREETGLGPGDVTLERVSPLWVGYELPTDMRSAKTGRGQVHRWFVFRVLGRERPAVPVDDIEEFRAVDWAPLPEIARRVVAFRGPVYAHLVDWLGVGRGDGG